MNRLDAILVLARRRDRSYREIGETLGISAQAVAQAVKRHAPKMAADRARNWRRYVPVPCPQCGRPMRRRSLKTCSRTCAARAKRDEQSIRAKAYKLRRAGLKWREVVAQLRLSSVPYAITEARRYAESRGQPWPVARRK